MENAVGSLSFRVVATIIWACHNKGVDQVFWSGFYVAKASCHVLFPVNAILFFVRVDSFLGRRCIYE
ncbi:MAG: hypothetical protein ACK56I_05435, partial [bacterium]